MLLIPIVPVEKMSDLIFHLYAINTRGIWQTAIKEVLDSGDIRKLTKLVNELRSESEANPPKMVQIIGQDAYNALFAL